MQSDDPLASVIDELKQLLTGLDVRLAVERIDDTTHLFDGGLGLDSFAVVEFIISIEENFAFEFQKSDLIPESFRDLRTLGAVVAANLQRSA
jgi:acyl carrier protein